MKNDIVWYDILALSPDRRVKLHLTDEEIALTDEDIELINTSSDVDLVELKELMNKAGFANYDIVEEVGISKAMYSMAFSEASKNRRGLRMRTVVAMLNAIRNRNVTDSFDKVLVKLEGKNIT